ncbi:NAD-dependent succinate-semialdehyde dehydrogenase [Aeromicrobium sp. P5_D10]
MTGPTPPTTDLIDSVDRLLLIDGRWRESTSGALLEVENPATQSVLTHVADAAPEDGLAAVQAAVGAQNAWSRTPAQERSDILRRAYELVIQQAERLAHIVTLEMGKPLAEARGEVMYAANFLRWFSEATVRINGEFRDSNDGTQRWLVRKEPVGPALLITPWNFPIAMAARKIGPALAAGCTVVLKPAPQTPLSSLALANILMQAGLPAGVLNVVPTSSAAAVVQPLLQGGDIRKMSFTGSTAVGRILLEQSGAHIVRTSLELGGNAPFIVFGDADMEQAIDGAIDAKMRNMGEACTAANRFLVARDIATDFAERLAERMGRLRVGDGLHEGTEVGPLIDRQGQDKVDRLVTDAREKGATMLVGGSRPEGAGYFYSPTVLVDVPGDSLITREEIFGPVAAIQTFDSEDEAIRIANDTPWGLSGYVFTQDLERAFRTCESLKLGMVGLNSGIVSNPSIPFGGIKESGIGREGGLGGIDEFLEQKFITFPVRAHRS